MLLSSQKDVGCIDRSGCQLSDLCSCPPLRYSVWIAVCFDHMRMELLAFIFRTGIWSVLISCFCAALSCYSHANVYYKMCHTAKATYGYKDVRRLGYAEAFQTVASRQYGSFRTTHVVRIKGPVTPEAVRRSLWALMARYPTLRMGVHQARISFLLSFFVLCYTEA